MLYHHQSIGLAEKRLFPLNFTPKRSQSLKTIDFVPVADFTPNPVSRKSYVTRAFVLSSQAHLTILYWTKHRHNLDLSHSTWVHTPTRHVMYNLSSIHATMPYWGTAAGDARRERRERTWTHGAKANKDIP